MHICRICVGLGYERRNLNEVYFLGGKGRLFQRSMIGVFKFNMKIVVKICDHIKMNGMRSAALNVMAMTVVAMVIAAAVVFFLLNVQSMQRVMRHPRRK